MKECKKLRHGPILNFLKRDNHAYRTVTFTEKISWKCANEQVRIRWSTNFVSLAQKFCIACAQIQKLQRLLPFLGESWMFPDLYTERNFLHVKIEMSCNFCMEEWGILSSKVEASSHQIKEQQ